MAILDKQKALDERIKMVTQLRNARAMQWITCEELGRRIGLSRMTVSRIEKGGFCPGCDTLALLADALGYEWVLKKEDGV